MTVTIFAELRDYLLKKLVVFMAALKYVIILFMMAGWLWRSVDC